jgi:2-desacetyl-2-hydroxyethyl bacteriochlorophyllide A dehydrogenase
VIVGIGRPGAFAELVAVPQAALLELPQDMSDEAGALVEPLAVVVHAFSGRTYTNVVVIGAGSIGLLATQVARASGAESVVVTDLSEERLVQATALGATATILAGEELPTADLVVDCVGASATKQVAVRAVRAGGTIVLLGLHDDDLPILSRELTRREITLAGSYTYTWTDIRRSLDLLAGGQIRFDTWTASRPLADGATAFHELVHTPGALAKILLRPDTAMG